MNGEWAEAESTFREALIIAEATGDLNSQGEIHNNLNYVLFRMGEYREGIDETFKELEINLELGNDTVIAVSYYNLGLNFKNIGSFDLASGYFLKALELNEKIKYDEGIASVHNTLGNLHRKFKSYEKAIEYHQSALFIYERLKDTTNIPTAYHSLGQDYKDSGLFSQARYCLFHAKQMNEIYGFSVSSNNAQIGSFYQDIGKLDSAQYFLEMALEQRKSEGSVVKIESAHKLLATLFLEKKLYTEAALHLDTAYTIAHDHEVKDDLIEILVMQIGLQKKRGSEIGLIEKYEELIELKEYIYWKRDMQSSAEFEYKYRARKMEQKIQLSNGQLQLQTLENERLSIRNTAFLVGLIVATLFVIIIILFYLKLRRSKKETEQKNELLRQSNELIDSLHKELSHRTKNYYHMFAGILKYDKKRCDNEETKKLLNNYISRVEAMSQIQRYLLEDDNLSNEVQLDLYLMDLLSNIDLVLNKGEHQVIISKHFETISCDYDKALRLGLVMNEMVSNAFEHGLNEVEDPKLDVVLTMNDSEIIHLVITDNGSGFSGSKSMSVESSLGIGLMDMILKSVQGNLSYVDQAKKGVSVKIIIPK